MPWTHCKNDQIRDDAVCPGCGITKAAWTVEVKVTRRLVIGNKAELVVRVEGGDGQPIGGVKVQVLAQAAVSNKTEWSGETQESGEAAFTLPPAHYRVTFPAHPASSFSSDPALFEPLALRRGQRRCVFVLAPADALALDLGPDPDDDEALALDLEPGEGEDDELGLALAAASEDDAPELELALAPASEDDAPELELVLAPASEDEGDELGLALAPASEDDAPEVGLALGAPASEDDAPEVGLALGAPASEDDAPEVGLALGAPAEDDGLPSPAEPTDARALEHAT